MRDARIECGLQTLILVLLMLLSAPRATSYAWYGTMHGADLVATEAMLGDGRELNVLMRTRTRRIVVKTLAVPLMAEVDRALMSRGRRGRRTAWAARIVIGGVYGYAVFRNQRIAR